MKANTNTIWRRSTIDYCPNPRTVLDQADLRALYDALETIRCRRCGRSGLDHRDADHVLVELELGGDD